MCLKKLFNLSNISQPNMAIFLLTTIFSGVQIFPQVANAQSISRSETLYLKAFDQLELQHGYLLNHAYLDHDQVASFYLEEGEQLTAREIKTNYNKWQCIYRDMWKAGTDYIFAISNLLTNRDYPELFPKLDEIVPDQSRENNEVLIGIIFMDTDYVYGDSIEYYLNTDSTMLLPETPMHIVNVLNVSNLRKRVYYTDVDFKIDTDLLFSNRTEDVLGLAIDFGDGMGLREFDFTDQSISVSYSTYGKKTIHYQLITPTGNLLCTSSIEICPIFTDDFEEDLTLVTSSGDTVGGHFNGFNGCDGEFDRPVLIVGGFEIEKSSDPRTRYERYLKNGLAEYLQGAGYDLVTIGFDNTHLPMASNAEVLQQVIENINTRKMGNHDNIIIGESMGGVISRICLRSMEDQGLDHQMRLYISFDAPHKGANTPLSIQETLYDALNADVSSIFAFIVGGLLGDFVLGPIGALYGGLAAENLASNYIEGQLQGRIEDQLGGGLTLEVFEQAVTAPSVVDIYLRNRYPEEATEIENDTINPMYLKFQGFLDSLGFPQQSRNISLINGSNTARPQALFETIDDEEIQTLLTPGDSLINVKKRNVLTYALISFTDVTDKLVSAISRRKNRFFFNIQEKGRFSFGSRNFDLSPGSLPDDDFVFAFVPSASGIALQTAMFETPDGLVIYNDGTSSGGLSRTELVAAALVPFDDIYAQSTNTPHLKYEALGEQVSMRLKQREFMLDTFDLQNRLFPPGQQRQISATELIAAGAVVNHWSTAQEPKLYRTGAVNIAEGAALQLRSEETIQFKPGFSVAAGGELSARIVASVSGCPEQKMYSINDPTQNIIATPDLKSWIFEGTLLATVDNYYGPAKEGSYSWELIGLDTYVTGKGRFFEVDNLTTGYYTLTCSLFKGIKSNSIIVFVQSGRQSADEQQESQAASTLTLYPNPTHNTLQWTDGQTYQIALYDAQGRLVQEQQHAQSVDLSGLPAGPYAIVLRSRETGQVIKQIIIKE